MESIYISLPASHMKLLLRQTSIANFIPLQIRFIMSRNGLTDKLITDTVTAFLSSFLVLVAVTAPCSCP